MDEAVWFVVRTTMKESMWKRLEPPCSREIRDEALNRETAEAIWFYAKSAMEELIEKASEAGRFCVTFAKSALNEKRLKLFGSMQIPQRMS